MSPRFDRRTTHVYLGALILFSGLVSNLSIAQEQSPVSVPLKKVVLFNSGVGFFEHKGEVEGNASLEMKFNVEAINDLLKSMVLQDLNGGKISAVSYGSKDPITKTLKTFTIDLTNNPTLADLLGQIRGEAVEVETSSKITGKILGVEKRKRPIGDKDVIEVEMLNLLTDTGLRSVQLDQVQSIRLQNQKIDQDLRQALAILATGVATDKKSVSLSFTGEGKRQVEIGYIQETPVWKTSYRLVLDEEKEPFLQGWAIVENTTEEDWNNVQLSLISGRPISFRMDLYQPLYVQRPLVVPELYSSLSPQKYEQDLAEQERLLGMVAEKKSPGRGGAVPAAPPATGAAFGRARKGAELQDAGAERASRLADMGGSVQSMASGDRVGELFEYEIETPVTVQRQRSAMLPIVNGSIKGEKVSIYDPSVQTKHPLNGLKLTNSTDLHLLQGPITVFDDGIYAGDAQFDDIPPKGERLISYALDLQTEVVTKSSSAPQQLLSVKIAKGMLMTKLKYTRHTNYTVKNSSPKTKKVLLVQPLDSVWSIVGDLKPTETTRDAYRFALNSEPGSSQEVKVTEERTEPSQFALIDVDPNLVQYYLKASVTSEKVKEALKEIGSRKEKLAASITEKNRLTATLAVIKEEQERIRQNMAQLEKNSELYNRYVKKFTDQEDLNDKTRIEIEKTDAAIGEHQKSLSDYVSGLELE